MAETVKKGRPKKATTETTAKVENTVEINNNDQSEIIKQLMEQIQKQNEQMELLKKEIDNKNSQQVIVQQQGNNFSSKKIKCINLMHNPLNVSTEPNGRGRVYNFPNYGDVRMIKFDDLSDIVASYPYTMEHGFCYICDKEVVEALSLTDEYEKIYNKELLDEILWLRKESDLELFLGVEKGLQESTAMEIAKLINANEQFDFNYLRKIKDECGIDIEAIANNLKDSERKPTDEE